MEQITESEVEKLYNRTQNRLSTVNLSGGREHKLSYNRTIDKIIVTIEFNVFKELCNDYDIQEEDQVKASIILKKKIVTSMSTVS